MWGGWWVVVVVVATCSDGMVEGMTMEPIYRYISTSKSLKTSQEITENR